MLKRKAESYRKLLAELETDTDHNMLYIASVIKVLSFIFHVYLFDIQYIHLIAYHFVRLYIEYWNGLSKWYWTFNRMGGGGRRSSQTGLGGRVVASGRPKISVSFHGRRRLRRRYRCWRRWRWRRFRFTFRLIVQLFARCRCWWWRRWFRWARRWWRRRWFRCQHGINGSCCGGSATSASAGRQGQRVGQRGWKLWQRIIGYLQILLLKLVQLKILIVDMLPLRVRLQWVEDALHQLVLGHALGEEGGFELAIAIKQKEESFLPAPLPALRHCHPENCPGRCVNASLCRRWPAERWASCANALAPRRPPVPRTAWFDPWGTAPWPFAANSPDH